MHIAIFFLISLLQAGKPVPVEGLPAETGIYFRQEKGWLKLQPAHMADMKTRGMDLFLETDGYSGLDLTIEYLGARAGVQVRSPQPVFYVRGAGAAKDALVIKLTEKKDRRTVRTSSLDATAENRGGFRKSDVRHVSVEEFADGSFSVTTDQILKPGEYLLVFGPANTGYDFSIPKK